jgi:hypothetical protein
MRLRSNRTPSNVREIRRRHSALVIRGDQQTKVLYRCDFGNRAGLRSENWLINATFWIPTSYLVH